MPAKPIVLSVTIAKHPDLTHSGMATVKVQNQGDEKLLPGFFRTEHLEYRTGGGYNTWNDHEHMYKPLDVSATFEFSCRLGINKWNSFCISSFKEVAEIPMEHIGHKSDFLDHVDAKQEHELNIRMKKLGFLKGWGYNHS